MKKTFTNFRDLNPDFNSNHIPYAIAYWYPCGHGFAYRQQDEISGIKQNDKLIV